MSTRIVILGLPCTILSVKINGDAIAIIRNIIARLLRISTMTLSVFFDFRYSSSSNLFPNLTKVFLVNQKIIISTGSIITSM